MKKIKVGKAILFILTFFIVGLLIIVFKSSLFGEKLNEASLGYIELPENFMITIFADLDKNSIAYPGPNPGPRLMEFKDNTLLVSVPKQGRIVALPDNNEDGKADKIIEVITGLANPHGLAFYQDWIYVAEEEKIIRAKDVNNDLLYEKNTVETIIDNLPTGGHWTRTIRIYNDSLYVSIGSSCNSCIEKDERRAAILKCNIDGNNCEIFASGTRNAVGFVFHPTNGKIYATENSRDMLGEDLPPDEINIIEKGKNYGWPFCYGKNVADPTYNGALCSDKEPSLADLQAHSAPLGLAFYNGDQFPQDYKEKLFVAYHGSWNRKIPTGYKIVTIDTKTRQVRDFATGWLTKEFKVLGRPVDVIADKAGNLFVSDDNAGLIYKISYEK